jgi:hypothetical protein
MDYYVEKEGNTSVFISFFRMIRQPRGTYRQVQHESDFELAMF